MNNRYVLLTHKKTGEKYIAFEKDFYQDSLDSCYRVFDKSKKLGLDKNTLLEESDDESLYISTLFDDIENYYIKRYSFCYSLIGLNINNRANAYIYFNKSKIKKELKSRLFKIKSVYDIFKFIRKNEDLLDIAYGR